MGQPAKHRYMYHISPTCACHFDVDALTGISSLRCIFAPSMSTAQTYCNWAQRIENGAVRLKYSPEQCLCLNWWHNFMLSSQIQHSKPHYFFQYNNIVRFCVSIIQATQHCMHAYDNKAVQSGRCTPNKDYRCLQIWPESQPV